MLYLLHVIFELEYPSDILFLNAYYSLQTNYSLLPTTDFPLPTSFYQFHPHMISFTLIVMIIRIQIIWKEKNTQYGKNNKKLYQDKYPKRFTNCHTPKSIAVKSNCLLQKGRNSHIANLDRNNNIPYRIQKYQ